ncbi:IS4 family transposase [Kitasatospora herbaricolor]|uniref:IS4 family transposase n=1 Tax=Kitasatospora herbaricolor TaxID=68217 RepID=UPI0036DA150D
MPRIGQFKQPDGDRLSDRVAIALLTRTYPPELVDRAVTESGSSGRRQRLLPPRLVVYFVLAMCLFVDKGYQEVARMLTQGLSWAGLGAEPSQVPTAAAISRARVKLGAAPLKALFEQAVKSSGVELTTDESYGRRRLLMVDDMTFDVPDSEENVMCFGHSTARAVGPSELPQVRVMALVEYATRAIVHAAAGPPANVADSTPADDLFTALRPTDLLVADHALVHTAQWAAAVARGADLLCPVGPEIALPIGRELPDGSHLSDLADAYGNHITAGHSRVRVISYTGGRSARLERHRLITSIVDHETAPAAELAALYSDRCEAESPLRDLKTRQMGRIETLRSRTPECVEQEIWGHLLVHHAIGPLLPTAPGSRTSDEWHGRLFR